MQDPMVLKRGEMGGVESMIRSAKADPMYEGHTVVDAVAVHVVPEPDWCVPAPVDPGNADGGKVEGL